MAQSSLENVSEQTFTESTIRQMYRLIDRAKTDASFQKLVYGVVNRAMPGQWKNYRAELSTLLTWARNAADYRRDPYGVELLQDVWATLDRSRGDCDDFTVLLGSAVEILGAPIRIVTVSTRRDREPSHVFLEALVGGKWLGLDATMKGTTVGWSPAGVTAKKIWSRKELGLGGDDLEGIEGLGMLGNGYSDVPGFKTDMFPVSARLAPGVPDDISDTYANPIPGTNSVSRRVISQAPIANVSDRTSNPRAGGGVYQPALPVKSFPAPAELWGLMDRGFIPKLLNPDAAWWGSIPTAAEDFNKMFPGSEVAMSNYLKEVASVPASAIAELTEDVGNQLALGEIADYEVPDAIGEALEDYALGKLPRTKRVGAARAAERRWRHGKHKGSKNAAAPAYQMATRPAPVPETRYLVPGPKSYLQKVRGGGLNGLGDIVSDLSKSLSTAIATGSVPTDSASVTAAINTAVNSALAPKPASTPLSVAVAKTAIPMGMLALLAGAAFLMTRGGKKRSYRNNPSRRRSRGRRRSYGRRGGRRSGGGGMTHVMILGGGALAAWYLLLRPGAALQPRVPTSTAALPKPPSSTQQYAALAVQAAPSIVSAISSLFGSSSSPKIAEDGAIVGQVQTDWSNL